MRIIVNVAVEINIIQVDFFNGKTLFEKRFLLLYKRNSGNVDCMLLFNVKLSNSQISQVVIGLYFYSSQR